MTQLKEKWSSDRIKALLRKQNLLNFSGPMSDVDILNALYTGELYISPFDRTNMTPIGYNLRTSDIVISTKSGLPLRICQNGKKKYVIINPNDTVLVATRESVYVGCKIMGTFHSRVKIVSQGFGHISTTLDPEWKGPLLIAISNPTGKKKKLIIEDSDGRTAFVTIVFYRFSQSPQGKHDNPPIRIDILEEYLSTPKGLKRFLVGPASQQYSHMVEILKQACHYDPAKLPLSYHAINELEMLFQSIINQYVRNGCLDAVTFASLEEKITQEHALPDLPPLCMDLLEIITAAIAYFDPMLQEHTNDFDPCEYKAKILDLLEAGLAQLRYERQAQIWINAQTECSKIAQSSAFSNLWMRIILTPPWKHLLPIIFCIIILIVGMVLLVHKQSDLGNFSSAAWAFLFSFLLFLIQSLFKDKNE